MASIKISDSALGKPWRFTGTSMQPNVLLMCKLLFILMCVHGFQNNLQDPFLPYLSVLDFLRSDMGIFGIVQKIMFLGAGFCLIFNIKVRAAAITLGLMAILALLASKPLFRNHIFICGCLFLLSGLHRRDEKPWMIPIQLSILYFGAFLNKILDIDWRTGQFMENWLGNARENYFYDFFSPMFPDLWFGALLSWLVMISEVALVICFLFRRWHNKGVHLALLMHLVFFLVVGRRPFGFFMEDILLAMLVFLTWPKATMIVQMRPSLERLTTPFKRFLNWDNQFIFEKALAGKTSWFELRMNNSLLTNCSGLFTFLKYNTAFYTFLFFAYNGIAYIVSRLPSLL
jgi:hypothetical protein